MNAQKGLKNKAQKANVKNKIKINFKEKKNLTVSKGFTKVPQGKL